MQSSAPQKQKIAGRSDSSEDTKEEEAFDIIENIEAITEDNKKEEAELDSSDSTITETEAEDKDPPETEGGSIKKAVEALAIPASISGAGTSQVGVLSNTSDSSSSSGTSSRSTGGSSKSDISSSDSSDSSRSLYSSDSDSDTSAAEKKKYKCNKMPSSSIIKSPVSDKQGYI
jgi:hypothetical protein